METGETINPKGERGLMLSAGKTVLIVEPLPDQQWKLARMFTVGGFRVIGTSSMPAAQALLHSCPVDLILLSPEACKAGPREAARGLLTYAPNARLLVMDAGKAATGTRDRTPTSPSTARQADESGLALEFVRRPARAADVTALVL